MKKFLILNGANLNMLGIREPNVYGKKTYRELLALVRAHAKKIGVKVCFYQSNHEGDLIDAVQRAYFKKFDGIVLNPGGYTHTSVALADALKAVSLPCAEVHISDISKREDFRQISYVRTACVTTIAGEGFLGYTKALDFLNEYKRDDRVQNDNGTDDRAQDEKPSNGREKEQR